MKQNMGESVLAVWGGQLQKADDTPEILNFSMKRRMFFTLLILCTASGFCNKTNDVVGTQPNSNQSVYRYS